MNEPLSLKILMPRLQYEIDRCEYGEVSLTVSVYAGRITKWSVSHTYTSKSLPAVFIDDPHPADNA